MPASKRKTRPFRAELADLVFHACSAAGLVLGFLWAYQQPAPSTPSSCGRDRVGECLGDGLIANALPYVAGITVGVLSGAVIGMLLSRGITQSRGAR